MEEIFWKNPERTRLIFAFSENQGFVPSSQFRYDCSGNHGHFRFAARSTTVASNNPLDRYEFIKAGFIGCNAPKATFTQGALISVIVLFNNTTGDAGGEQMRMRNWIFFTV